MKKKAIIIVLIWCLFVGILWPYRIKAEALGDPLTAAMVGSASYALFSEWGLATSFSAGTPGYSQGFMNNAIEDYVNASGGSIADLFGSEAIKIVAGKLVVAQQLYNGIKNFADWIIDTYNIDNISKLLGYDGYIYTPIADPSAQGTDYAYGTSGYCTQEDIGGGSIYWIVYLTSIYGTVNRIQGPSASRYNYYSTSIDLYKQSESQWQAYYVFTFERINSTAKTHTSGYVDCATFHSTTSMQLLPDYVEPTVLNPGEHWEGEIDGWTGPDTNLDDLMNDIFTDVADNNLSVEGEVIPGPAPTPQPEPIEPDTPLQDVPWEGLNDLIDNSTDSIMESVGEAASDITGAIEGTQEAVESLEGTITESLDVPAAEDIAGRKFDLSTLFPFCIPFDIYRMLQAFDGTPEAPHVQLPFVIQSLGFSYTFDLDFSAFDSVAAIMRTVEFIAFGIFLAFSTSKVIRW